MWFEKLILGSTMAIFLFVICFLLAITVTKEEVAKCIINEENKCHCEDFGEGFQVCVDGKTFSDCICKPKQ